MADLAVTGSTGALGGRVARALADLGIEQRLIVRSVARAPRLDGAEVREVPGGYSDPAGYREALEGIGTLFLVSAEEAPDRVAQHRNVIEAAAAAGVERIVYTSFLGAAEDSTFLLGRHHWATEEAIREAGVSFTFLRDSFYMDFIPFFAGPERTFRGPAGDGRLSPVSRDDVAAVAVQVLSALGAHDGRAYGLTGPELFSLTEAAERLTAYTGEPYSYVEETIEEAWESRRPSGAADWMIEGWVSTYTAIADGSLDQLSGDVEAVTGRPPQTLEQTLDAHPELLSGDLPG
ncbi:MAG TPA: SDR family oxidoreductase [Solirubrobacterales bacterium]|nr:SDR family oxidoreductase [Solirubrobacterales bacterium]